MYYLFSVLLYSLLLFCLIYFHLICVVVVVSYIIIIIMSSKFWRYCFTLYSLYSICNEKFLLCILSKICIFYMFLTLFMFFKKKFIVTNVYSYVLDIDHILGPPLARWPTDPFARSPVGLFSFSPLYSLSNGEWIGMGSTLNPGFPALTLWSHDAIPGADANSCGKGYQSRWASCLSFAVPSAVCMHSQSHVPWEWSAKWVVNFI